MVLYANNEQDNELYNNRYLVMAVFSKTVGKMQYQWTDTIYPYHSASTGTVCFTADGKMFVNHTPPTPAIPDSSSISSSIDSPLSTYYTNGFEIAASRSLFTLVNDPTNQWVTSNGSSIARTGTYALYISDDGGTTDDYTGASPGNNERSHAYTTFSIPSGSTNVTLSFWWYGNGEGDADQNYDNGRCYLGTASLSIPAAGGDPSPFDDAQNPVGAASASWVSVGPEYDPDASLDGSGPVNVFRGQTSYTQFQKGLDSLFGLPYAYDTTWYLMFTGKTDGSTGGSPPISLFVIDDITIQTPASSSNHIVNHPGTSSIAKNGATWKPIIPQVGMSQKFGKDPTGVGTTGQAFTVGGGMLSGLWYSLAMLSMSVDLQQQASSSVANSTLRTDLSNSPWIEPKVQGIYEMHTSMDFTQFSSNSEEKLVTINWQRSGSDFVNPQSNPQLQQKISNGISDESLSGSLGGYHRTYGWIRSATDGGHALSLNDFIYSDPWRDDKFAVGYRFNTSNTNDTIDINGFDTSIRLMDYTYPVVRETFETVTSGYRLTGSVTSTDIYKNTWNFSNDPIQQWVISSSQVYQGTSAAYTSWTGSNYAAATTASGIQAYSYMWTDFDLPADTDWIDINFKYTQGITLGSHVFEVWLAPLSVAPPSASVAYSSSWELTDMISIFNESNWIHASQRLTASLDNTPFSDTSHRLVFGWRTTGNFISNNYAAVDNVQVIFKTK